MKNNNLNLVFLITSSVILMIVYYLEYFLNLKPCILCIYQRLPYFFAVLLGIFFLLTKNHNTRKILYYLYLITFLTGLVLATYHFGIEKNLWIAYAGLVFILIVAIQLIIGGLVDLEILNINEKYINYF